MCIVCYVCVVSEQRVTGILVFVMVGLSALMADLLKVLPISCILYLILLAFSACLLYTSDAADE